MASVDILAGVTFNDATVITATEIINSAKASSNPSQYIIDNAPPAPTAPTTGQTFTLTVGPDTLAPNSAVPANKTTDFDDTIRAVTPGSLETTDSINAGGGNDTMNVAAGAIAAGAVPVLTSVETINITSNAADTLGLLDSTGIDHLNVTSTGASVVTLNDAALSTTFGTGLSTAAGTIDINILASTAGPSDTLKLALDDNNLNLATITSTAYAASIEAITVEANGSHAGTSVAGNNAADFVDINAFGNIKTLTVTGDGNSNIAGTSAVLATVNAANANGNNTYNINSGVALTVTTGSGNDTVTLGGPGNHIINTGAGNDTITSFGANNTFNGGLGADTYNSAVGPIDKFSVQTSTIETGFGVQTGSFTTTSDTLQFVGGPAKRNRLR